jgi:hypothetical protein
LLTAQTPGKTIQFTDSTGSPSCWIISSTSAGLDDFWPESLLVSGVLPLPSGTILADRSEGVCRPDAWSAYLSKNLKDHAPGG